MDETMNELAFIAIGMYGKKLPEPKWNSIAFGGSWKYMGLRTLNPL